MKILSRAIIVAAFAAGVLNTVKASETDYTKGIMIVNEDWYGHQNSTVNYLLPDDVDGDSGLCRRRIQERNWAARISMVLYGTDGCI